MKIFRTKKNGKVKTTTMKLLFVAKPHRDYCKFENNKIWLNLLEQPIEILHDVHELARSRVPYIFASISLVVFTLVLFKHKNKVVAE